MLVPQVDPLVYYSNDPEPHGFFSPLDLVVPLEEASTKALDLQLPGSYLPLGCNDNRIHAIYTKRSHAVSHSRTIQVRYCLAAVLKW